MLKWFANYRNDQHFGPEYRPRMEVENRLNDGRLLDYRLGINVMNYRGMEVVRHAGGMPGYLCDFVFFPQADLGIVLFSNLLSPAMLQLQDRIADIVLENEFDRPLETTFLDAGREEIAALKGVYASENEALVLELADQDGKMVCFLLGDINPLHEHEGWLQSRENLVSVRLPDQSAGQGGGLELRLGCQAPYQLAAVADPRSKPGSSPNNFVTFAGRYYHEGFEEVHEVSLHNDKLRVEIPSPLRELVWGELTPVAGETGPFVLAGHSFGGLFSANFAHHYPDLVAGVVLLDSTPPWNVAFVGKLSFSIVLRKAWWGALASHFGLSRLVEPEIDDPDSDLARELHDVSLAVNAHSVQPKSLLAEASVFKSCMENPLDLVIGKGALGDIPLLLMSANPTAEEQAELRGQLQNMMGLSKFQTDNLLQGLNDSNDQQVALSSCGRHMLMPEGASHMFPYEYPELVLSEVRKMMNPSQV
jgi:pimeloyl-ACP methyl ester carboxylesterase